MKLQTNSKRGFLKKLVGSRKGVINFGIGIIAWTGWLVLKKYQNIQIHETVDPSYNLGDDGPLQISLGIEIFKYLLILGPACLIAFPFGFWSWWRERTANNWPYIFDVIGCFLTGGFLVYPCGWFILGVFLG